MARAARANERKLRGFHGLRSNDRRVISGVDNDGGELDRTKSEDHRAALRMPRGSMLRWNLRDVVPQVARADDVREARRDTIEVREVERIRLKQWSIEQASTPERDESEIDDVQFEHPSMPLLPETSPHHASEFIESCRAP